MAKLMCTRHNRRVVVIDIGTDNNPVPLTVHRNGSKHNDVCDTNTVTIDGEFFLPFRVLADDWSDVEVNA